MGNTRDEVCTMHLINRLKPKRYGFVYLGIGVVLAGFGLFWASWQNDLWHPPGLVGTWRNHGYDTILKADGQEITVDIRTNATVSSNAWYAKKNKIYILGSVRRKKPANLLQALMQIFTSKTVLLSGTWEFVDQYPHLHIVWCQLETGSEWGEVYEPLHTTRQTRIRVSP